MPRDVSLSDSKCWNGGHEWVNELLVRRAEEANNDATDRQLLGNYNVFIIDRFRQLLGNYSFDFLCNCNN